MRFLTVLALASVLALVLGSAPAFGATAFAGATFGLDVLSSNGSSVTALAAPASPDFFVGGIRPGLRVGAISADGHDMGFVDTGLSFVSSDGSDVHSIIATLNYAHVFGEAPYVTFGAGMGHIGAGEFSESLISFGGGVGVRHVLSHGHGAFRFEVRYDNLNRTEGGSDALNIFGFKLGFDLMGS